MKNYNVCFVKCDNWYAAYVPELPGAHSQGRTIAEAKRNIKEAIKLIIDSNRKRFKKEIGRKRVVSDIVSVAG